MTAVAVNSKLTIYVVGFTIWKVKWVHKIFPTWPGADSAFMKQVELFMIIHYLSKSLANVTKDTITFDSDESGSRCWTPLKERYSSHWNFKHLLWEYVSLRPKWIWSLWSKHTQKWEHKIVYLKYRLREQVKTDRVRLRCETRLNMKEHYWMGLKQTHPMSIIDTWWVWNGEPITNGQVAIYMQWDMFACYLLWFTASLFLFFLNNPLTG